jgi:hypothetical protein
MSYKPTNEAMIAYLYGEIEASQKAQIDQYLIEHPEFKTEFEELENTRMLMGQLEDIEVPSPITFMKSNTNTEWMYWRKYVAIAASILLIMTFGKIIGFNLSIGDKGFQAGFGTIQQGLDAETVNEMLQADRNQLVNWVQDNIETVQDSLGGEMKMMQASMDDFQSQEPETLQISDTEIDLMLERQKEDLMFQMAQLSEKMTGDYRDVFKGLYDSFANDIDLQRSDDLRNIQAAFTTLENATISKQDEVDEALFNISQEINTLVAQNNNN